MKLPADKITNILGVIAAILIIQQAYFPDLLPKEYVAPILATIVSTFGVATNKKTITITFNGKKEEETSRDIEQEIDEFIAQLEELKKQCCVPNKKENE